MRNVGSWGQVFHYHILICNQIMQGLYDSNSHARSITSPLAVTGAKIFITTMLFV